MSIWNWTVFAGVYLIMSAPAGLALEQSRDDYGSVRGKVAFEPRSTIVPMMICEQKICPKSRPWWAMVIYQDGIQYEMDEQFAIGSETAPESMEIVGAVIRPGSTIVVEGRIEVIVAGYAIISDVRRIDLAMD